MKNGRAMVSTDVFVAYSVQGEIMTGYTLLTAKAQITALCEGSKALRFANMADIRSVHDDAVASCWWQNVSSTASAPTFTSIVS